MSRHTIEVKDGSNGYLAWHSDSYKASTVVLVTNEPRREKTGLRGFRQGLTQTDLYSHRSGLEA